jgi:hypothetical protein
MRGINGRTTTSYINLAFIITTNIQVSSPSVFMGSGKGPCAGIAYLARNLTIRLQARAFAPDVEQNASEDTQILTVIFMDPSQACLSALSVPSEGAHYTPKTYLNISFSSGLVDGFFAHSQGTHESILLVHSEFL